mgnify:FL=1
MTLFDNGGNEPLFPEQPQVRPTRRRRPGRGMRVGTTAIAVALLALAGMSFLPTGSVIQHPGPVFDTLGTAPTSDGKEIPLISVAGAESYPTGGTLDLTTVQVRGNREQQPSWFEVVLAWFDPSRAIMPLDSVFPPQQTTEQREEMSAQDMVNSQQDGIAAALLALDYDVTTQVRVVSIADGSPSVGVLEIGDIVRTVNGEHVETNDRLREIIQDGAGAPLQLVIDRAGTQREVELTPTWVVDTSSPDGAWRIGVGMTHDYDFPIDVTIQLDNVGGPSAGQMFALGIIDTLTPGELNGGKNVAGTGTIAADGTIGPIGGIRQKLFGARGAGAEYFLAPVVNCAEVVGHVPEGLRVFAVEDLDDSLAVMAGLRGEGDLDTLPSCDAVLAR